jgi:hypothetical protein
MYKFLFDALFRQLLSCQVFFMIEVRDCFLFFCKNECEINIFFAQYKLQITIRFEQRLCLFVAGYYQHLQKVCQN